MAGRSVGRATQSATPAGVVMTDDWIPISSGDDLIAVQVDAAARLYERGVDMSQLSDDELRIEVGTTIEHQPFYRVIVAPKVLES